MNKHHLTLYQGILLFGVCCTAQADQLVSLATTTPFVSSGDTAQITAEYQVTAPETATETGLGLRVHFDSSLISPESISLHTDSVQPNGLITNDTEDYDNDPLTDSYFIVSWIDFNAQWPGTGQLPLHLLELRLGLNSDLNTSTSINLSSSATAKNTGFQSEPLQLCRKPAVSISTNRTTVNEGETTSPSPILTFQTDQTIPAGCDDLVLDYAVGGSATSGNDFSPVTQVATIPAGQDSTQITLNIINDDIVETDETITVALQNNDNYSLSADATASISIISEDTTSSLPEVNLSVGKLSVTEGQGGSLLLHVSRNENNLTQALEVMIELSGTATANNDFHTFPGSITIPAGRTQAHAVLVLIDDADQETDEILNIDIAVSENYQRGENSSLQLTIRDDELNQNTSLPAPYTQPTNQLSPTSAQQIPTVNQWMLVLIGLLLSGIASSRLTITKAGGKS